MKLLRTYKQNTTTWFVYSCLFGYVDLDRVYVHRLFEQHNLDTWMKSMSSITMRTKYEDN